MRGYWVAGVALLVISTQAYASCRDDLEELKPRIEQMKNTNKDRYGLASKWYNKAVESDEASDEAGCYNNYVRAYRSLSQPLPQVANCAGPNAYLPQCNAPAGGGPAFGGAPGPQFGGGAGGGGGGGGNAAARFNPPGSITGVPGGSIGGK